MTRNELLAKLNAWLQPERFRDVAENGLQVEGREQIQRVVCGVSANQALLDAAVEQEADAIFVHHGLVWGGGIRSLKGWLAARVRTLMVHEISLFAYHLPLDAHPGFGNNAGLADALGLTSERTPFGEYKGQSIGIQGHLAAPTSLDAVKANVAAHIGPPLAVFGEPGRPIERIGICSGGAPDLLHEAIDAGLDLYLTGEVTEWVQAVSQESGVAFIAAGHHATERFGTRNIAEVLRREGLDAHFVDVENPA